MRKKVMGFLLCLIGIIAITGCGSKTRNLTDYVSVEYSGLDTQGKAQVIFDKDRLYKDAFGYDSNNYANSDQQKAISLFESSVKTDFDKSTQLKNGDKIKLTIKIDESKVPNVKSGEKEFEVNGLEEAKKLTSAEVEKNLVVNFTGVSGRGKSKIDNMFSDSNFKYLDFKFEDEGHLKNGEKAKIVLSQNDLEALSRAGYVPEDNFAPTFEVKNLAVVAESADKISNLADVTRMIDEGIHREYKDYSTDYSFGTRYEIKEEKTMYRQFQKDNANESYSSSSDGTLVKLYSIKKYSGGSESKLEDSFTAIYGYTNIVLNDKNETNVAEMKEVSSTKDKTYSLESVIKLYNGYGYTEVKEKQS